MNPIETYVARLILIDALEVQLKNFDYASREFALIQKEINDLSDRNTEDMMSYYHDSKS